MRSNQNLGHLLGDQYQEKPRPLQVHNLGFLYHVLAQAINQIAIQIKMNNHNNPNLISKHHFHTMNKTTKILIVNHKRVYIHNKIELIYHKFKIKMKIQKIYLKQVIKNFHVIQDRFHMVNMTMNYQYRLLNKIKIFKIYNNK